MNTAALVSIFGISAAVSWGVADIYIAKSSKAVGPVLACLLVNVTESLLFAIIYLVFLRSNSHLDWISFTYAATAGAVLSFGAATFFKALKEGPVSIVTPIANTYPLITAILAILIFNASLSPIQLVGIILVVIGIMLASGLVSSIKNKTKIAKGPFWGILTSLFWGVGFVLLAQAIKRIDWQLATLIEYIFVATTLIVVAPFIKAKEKINLRVATKALKNKVVIIAMILQLVGVLFLNLGMSKESESGAVITAISACGPIITMLFALKIFNEKVKLAPLLGAIIGIIGVIVLSLG